MVEESRVCFCPRSFGGIAKEGMENKLDSTIWGLCYFPNPFGSVSVIWGYTRILKIHFYGIIEGLAESI